MMRANKHIYCGNNLRDLGLKANGGDREIGNHKDCFRKGYALGINQEIKDMNLFLRKWGTAYKPYIIQHLSYNAEKIPPGYQRATLAQALQRGFAIGSLARAKNEKVRDTSSLRGLRASRLAHHSKKQTPSATFLSTGTLGCSST